MNFLKIPLLVLVIVTLTGVFGVVAGLTQAQSTALERGYRTGYSDGYTAGFRDVTAGSARDYQSKEDYQKADRSYNDVWGPIEDYRDGYQQGFEAGYSAGFDRQQFNSSIPTGLRRRTNNGAPTAASNGSSTPADNTAPTDNSNPSAPAGGLVAIPRNTVLTLELLTPLSTDATQRGDRFQAKVTGPAEYTGSTVEGRVTQVKRPGKVKGVAELQLNFEQLRTPDNRVAGLHADLVEVLPMGSDNVSTVDTEGTVKGRDSTKDDAAKVGAASGIGAIIGVIAGGGKGAAIGAIIGGGAGTAGVMTQRGKDIRLDRGQQLRIRTSADASVQ